MRKIILSCIFLFVSTYCLAATPGFLKERMGSLNGQIVMQDGSPLAGGIVSFFNAKDGPPPMLMGGSRVPDAVFKVDAQGFFSAKLVPGTFYLGALQVSDPERRPGPPKPGEKFFFAVNEHNAPRIFTIKIRQKLDIGQITAFPPEKIIDERVYLTIEGKIVDQEGNPFADAVVLVKKDPQSMRPNYVSERVGADGRFTIKMPAGTYYLMARQVEKDSIVGQPMPGVHVGTYGIDTAPAEGMPGRSGPAGGISPPAGMGMSRAIGPATGITPGVGVDTGKAKPVSGKAGDVISGITIKVFPVARPEEEKAESYFKVTGTVYSADGKPLSGMQVHAKEHFTEFRAPFTSGVTDQSGSFQLELPAGKKYYLLARPTAVGPPHPGTLVGFYGLQKPLKQLLVFMRPGTPEYEEYFSQAQFVTGKADETITGVLIKVFPLGSGNQDGTIPLPGNE